MLRKYKMKRDMTPESIAIAEEKIEAGKALMDRGNLQAAMVIFDEAYADCAPLHKTAGEAQLQVTLSDIDSSLTIYFIFLSLLFFPFSRFHLEK